MRRRSPLPIEYLELNHDSPFARGLVGWWPVGAAQHWGSSRLLDLSPYRNHGTLTNMDPATDWVVDGERAGLDFDGANDYVRCRDSVYLQFSPTQPYTLVVQAYVQSTASGIIARMDNSSGYKGYDIYSRSSSVVRMHFIDTWSYKAIARDFSVSILDQWRHIVGRYDGSVDVSGLLLFVDGEQVTTYSDAVNILSPTDDTVSPREPTIMARANGSSAYQYTRGLVHYAAIYNRALSAAEIKQLYEETKDGSYGSLVRPRRRVRYWDTGGITPGGVVVPPHLLIGY